MNFTKNTIYMLLIITTILLPNNVRAKEIIICGESKGYSFYANGLGTENGSRWVDDGISNGKTILVEKDGITDIKYTDSTGVKSLRGEGFELFTRFIRVSNGLTITVMAIHNDVTEQYIFSLKENGDYKLIQGNFRANTIFTSGRLLVSNCITK